MSSSTHPIILYDFDVEDAFSSTNIPNYAPALLNYSPASPGNTFSDTLEDPFEDLLVPIAASLFSDDTYMKVIQAYYATNELPIPPPPAPIAPPLSLRIEEMEDKIRGLGNGRVIIHRDFDRLETKLEEARTQIAGLQKKQMGHDDEVVLARVRISTLEMVIEDIQVRHQSDIRNLLHAIHELKNNYFLEPLYPNMINNQDIKHMIPPTSPRDTVTPIGSTMPLSPSSLVGSSSPVRMAPKRTSTSAAPTMTKAAIRKLVADSVATALEAQAANVGNADNTNRNTKLREAPIARKYSYKEFMSCQPFNFKVKFATCTLTEEALSWWNSFAQPIGIEDAYKITWSEFKKLLIKKYCPQTNVKKMEDEFYNLTVKGNYLKTNVRRFQELAVLCPTMVPNSEKMMEVFIEGLPRSSKGNVIASKPQTLEEAIIITQSLIDQVIKHNSMQ
uniref:Reverse transcriptase domain-containing protein n=1 Tax=Tanacetum cinerariifolium TaxID=118510 RepID=A0A699GXM9_TANCI|nr:reverse transcriptase domain-containing protein [Tanacetum cinerariifolium]